MKTELIKCFNCLFAQPDKTASEWDWTAYECTCINSEFHKSLLNVTPKGHKLKGITWSGCKFGERRLKDNV